MKRILSVLIFCVSGFILLAQTTEAEDALKGVSAATDSLDGWKKGAKVFISSYNFV